jgi:hypothetical protein
VLTQLVPLLCLKGAVTTLVVAPVGSVHRGVDSAGLSMPSTAILGRGSLGLRAG